MKLLVTPQNRWRDLLRSGSALSDSRLYSAGEDAVAMATSGPAVTNTKELWAEAVLTTPRQDLEGDVIDPLGVRFDDYARNPVVLWEHGLGSIDTPIAKCEHPNGILSLVPSAEGILCRSYFSRRDKQSMQIFALIDEGLVRAMSIRATPIDESVRVIPFKSGERGLFVGESMMREATWCKLGMNPEAVAKCLDRGRINGEALVPDLAKSLAAVAAPQSVAGCGLPDFSKTNGGNMDNNTHPDDEQKALDGQTDETIKSDEEVADEALEKTDEASEDEQIAAPYSATLMGAVHRSLSDLGSNLKAGLGPLEQEEVREMLAAMDTDISDKLLAIEGLHDKLHGEQLESLCPGGKCDGDGDEMKEDGAPVEDEEEIAKSRLKSWLKSNPNNKFTIRGYASRALALAAKPAGKPLTKSERALLKQMGDRLMQLEAEAAKAQELEISKSLQSLKEELSEIRKMQDTVLPRR